MMTSLVVIEDFEKPQTCWDCPILKNNSFGELYCGFLGDKNGIIKTYDQGFLHKQCKLQTLTFGVESRTLDDEEDYDD